MRFKPLPPTPPAGLANVDALAEVRDALPPVPRSEDDCSGRLVDRISWIDDRDVASEWIVLLRALEFVERSDAGYARLRGDLDPETIAGRFSEHVVGAEAAIDALGARPRSAESVFEAIRDEAVPEWERLRRDTWREVWRAHTERLLDWATLLGLAEQRDGGYVRA